MALLKLRHRSQITLPAELRKQFDLEEGDYLQAEATREGILLKPVRVIERQKAWDKVVEVMERVHAKQPPSDKSPEEQEEDIACLIKASRQTHGTRRS